MHTACLWDSGKCLYPTTLTPPGLNPPHQGSICIHRAFWTSFLQPRQEVDELSKTRLGDRQENEDSGGKTFNSRAAGQPMWIEELEATGI